MFSILQQPLIRVWPDIQLARFLRRGSVRNAGQIDGEILPEDLQRDLGILDGRGRRGERREEGAFSALRLIQQQPPI